MGSELPHSDPPGATRKSHRLEIAAICVAVTAVLIAVLHQSLISNPEIYRNRSFIILELFVLITSAAMGLGTGIKAAVLAFEKDKNAIMALLATIVVAVLFLFCFWYDRATLLYAT